MLIHSYLTTEANQIRLCSSELIYAQTEASKRFEIRLLRIVIHRRLADGQFMIL